VPADEAIRTVGLRVVRGGRVVLPGLDATVPAGEVVGLLGPSGCGKTTLLRALVGVQRIAGGEVRVLGRPAGDAALRSLVGYVTQAPSVYADLTIRENLRYFAAVLGASGARVKSVVDEVGLGDAVDGLVGELSGGQRARVSLATALLGEPELLILDEPTVGLDPVLRRDLWGHFAMLAAAGTTLVVSSHVMDEADRCDELLFVRSGKVIARGTGAQIRAQAETDDLEQAFLVLGGDVAVTR